MAGENGTGVDLDEPVFVAGHQGMVGSAIVRRLRAAGYRNLLLRSRAELDLTEQAAVRDFFATQKPAVVYMAAARVGGIYANNTFPADFIYQNTAIFTNVVQAAYQNRCRRLLFLGSSCIYPRLAPQPIPESALLTGPLEPTNEPYAIAKIAGIKMCDAYNRQYGTDYRSVMPTNLYGPNDNFDLKTSHVMPALMRKVHEARAAGSPSVEVWGSGRPRREFLHVDDMADACVFVMGLPKDRFATATSAMISHINVGTGEDIPIRELAELIKEAVGYTGELRFNPEYPDGTPRKLLDVSLLRSLGWKPAIGLREGIASTYAWFREHAAGA
jgi:GDP-L-fucose synthase